jgi:hypothetical protein
MNAAVKKAFDLFKSHLTRWPTRGDEGVGSVIWPGSELMSRIRFRTGATDCRISVTSRCGATFAEAVWRWPGRMPLFFSIGGVEGCFSKRYCGRGGIFTLRAASSMPRAVNSARIAASSLVSSFSSAPAIFCRFLSIGRLRPGRQFGTVGSSSQFSERKTQFACVCSRPE